MSNYTTNSDLIIRSEVYSDELKQLLQDELYAQRYVEWVDFGDGHLEYMQYDNPDVTTPMTFNTAKAGLVFGSRVDQDQTYSTSALFEGRTSIWLTPGDMFVFTLHKENQAVGQGGATFEFSEAI